MVRHFLTETAVLGLVLALAACDDADTIKGHDASKLVTTALSAESAPYAKPGYGKASMFTVPQEARILFW